MTKSGGRGQFALESPAPNSGGGTWPPLSSPWSTPMLRWWTLWAINWRWGTAFPCIPLHFNQWLSDQQTFLNSCGSWSTESGCDSVTELLICTNGTFAQIIQSLISVALIDRFLKCYQPHFVKVVKSRFGVDWWLQSCHWTTRKQWNVASTPCNVIARSGCRQRGTTRSLVWLTHCCRVVEREARKLVVASREREPHHRYPALGPRRAACQCRQTLTATYRNCRRDVLAFWEKLSMPGRQPHFCSSRTSSSCCCASSRPSSSVGVMDTVRGQSQGLSHKAKDLSLRLALSLRAKHLSLKGQGLEPQSQGLESQGQGQRLEPKGQGQRHDKRGQSQSSE